MQNGLTMIFTLIGQIVSLIDSFVLDSVSQITFLDFLIGMLCSLVISGAVFAPYISAEYAESHAWLRFKRQD